MKRVVFIIFLAYAVFASGCRHNEEPDYSKKKVSLELSASIKSTPVSRADGMINPISVDSRDGLPPEQLTIGILTIESVLDFIPSVEDWNSPSTAYLDRGFFGGNNLGDDPGMGSDWNGNIEYTNRSGTSLQQVFYDETGIYYYLVAVYPYNDIYDIEKIDDSEQEAMILDPTKGAMIIFSVDGSQDIMSTQLGKGNIEPENRMINPLIFKHRLSCLNCLFVAESQIAAELYGKITAVDLVRQPQKIGLNIGISALDENDPIFDVDTLKIDYPAVRSTTDALTLPYDTDPEDAIEAVPAGFGYMLAMRAQTYTFRITTEKRKAFYATYDFGTSVLPDAGRIYNLTFKMMESAEIVLEATPAKDWWLDQTYD